MASMTMICKAILATASRFRCRLLRNGRRSLHGRMDSQHVWAATSRHSRSLFNTAGLIADPGCARHGKYLKRRRIADYEHPFDRVVRTQPVGAVPLKAPAPHGST